MRNFALFDAPHVAVVTSERDLGTYAAVDCGVYLGHFLTAAQSLGLATIPQAAPATVAPVLRTELALPDNRMVPVRCLLRLRRCGGAPGNAFRTPVPSSTRFSRWSPAQRRIDPLEQDDGHDHQVVLVGSNAVRASRSADFPFGREPGSTIEAMIELEVRDRFAARRTTIRSGFGSEPDPHVLDWMTAQSLLMPSWAAVACYRSMLGTDLIADLAKVTMPVLQVIGEDDPVHSAKGARWLVERLTDSRLVTFADCGHYPMSEAPDALDRHVLDFLT